MPEAPVRVAELPAKAGTRIGLITLAAPGSLNAVDLAMTEVVLDALERWRQDPAIACLVIHGEGERAFCAGGDIRALYRSAVENPGGPCPYGEAFFAAEYRQDYLIHTFPKPVLVWGHGVTMGGGLGIMAGASHRVVTESSRLAMPEVTIGLFPDVGAAHFLPRLPGHCGWFLALTGVAVNAADCLYLGLATHLLPQAQFADCLQALQQEAWSDDAALNGQRLSALLRMLARSPASLGVAPQVEPNAAAIESLLRGESLPAIVAAIDALDTEDEWLQQARANLALASPLALHWTWRHFQRCRDKTLAEVLQLDLALATQLLRYPEFAEGVRALLIDKDRQPRWQYAGVQDVPETVVEHLLQAPWADNPLADLR